LWISQVLRSKFKQAVIANLQTATSNFPEKFIYIGLWKVANDGLSPELWEDIRTVILAEFDGVKNPKVGLWQDNLAPATIRHGRGNGLPIPSMPNRWSAPRMLPLPCFKRCRWSRPFADPAKAANAVPSDGIIYAIETYGTIYFELYATDIDQAATTPVYDDLLLGGAATLCAEAGAPPAPAANCDRTSVGLTPLNDLASGTYQGQQGGLYPGGSNTRPLAHELDGQVLAGTVQPLNASGAPDPEGRYVLLSIGMSNASMEFSTFRALADADPAKDPHLVIVNGAQSGWGANEIVDVNAELWTTIDAHLAEAGVTPQQVAVAWVKEADIGPTLPFPQDAQQLLVELAVITQILKARFPNLLLAYYSSRILPAMPPLG
jgi:hypothetical protein